MAITFKNTPIQWESEGTEPSDTLKNNGYTAGNKLPANHMNFFVNFIMKAINEIQTLLNNAFATKTELSEGLSSKANSSHTHSQYVTSTTLNSYAPKASPTFTGTPKAPTAVIGTNNTQIATTAFVKIAIEEYVELAISKLCNPTYGGLYYHKDLYGYLYDATLATSEAKISYAEYKSMRSGSTDTESVFKDIRILGTIPSHLPIQGKNNMPIFFRSGTAAGTSYLENIQYILYSDGTMYKRSRGIFYYRASEELDQDFGSWEESTAYDIFTV